MPEVLFHATVRHDANASVVEGRGELDISTAPLLTEAIRVALRPPPKVLVVDLKATTFFAGIGAEILLDLVTRCKETGTRLSVGASPAVQRVLDVVGFPPDALGAPRERHRFSLRLHRRLRESHRHSGPAGHGAPDGHPV